MPLRSIFSPCFWNAVNLFTVHFLWKFPEEWQFTKGARLKNLSWWHSTFLIYALPNTICLNYKTSFCNNRLLGAVLACLLSKFSFSMIRECLERIIYFVLLLFFFPIYLFGMTFWALKLTYLFLVYLFGLRSLGYRRFSKMGLISRKYPNVFDVTAVSTWKDLEFIYHRSACYLRRMATSISEDIAQVLVGKMKSSVLSDKQIINFFLHTGAASYLKYDKRKKTFGYCFEYIKSYVFHKNYYYDVREVRFTREEIIAISAGGKVYFKSKVSHADWKLLKLHLQTTMAFMIPATQHNWVHFCLPSAVAVSCEKLLPDTSILRQLLEPHYRFTERLNHQALFVCNASDNKNSFADKYFKPWLAFPMTKEVFIENVSKECQRYYNKRPEEFCPSLFLHDEDLVDIP